MTAILCLVSTWGITMSIEDSDFRNREAEEELAAPGLR